MKERVLQNGRLLPALEAALAERYDIHPLWREAARAAPPASTWKSAITIGGR